ncbi:uncharacterized protein TNCT_190751 [Trichonephila clavata]|uniref:Uncharacterized protein n=1 Tax=Trichonephila clavata TaxID=2740835 RepID=A0A8X6KBJ7_TRICU|nr:uncharacterized protein TNCT_190751 [Trichonephila clavata]
MLRDGEEGGPPSWWMGVEAGGALGAEGACPSRSRRPSLRGPLVSPGLADPWEEIAIALPRVRVPPTGEVLFRFVLPDDRELWLSSARRLSGTAHAHTAVRRMRIDPRAHPPLARIAF